MTAGHRAAGELKMPIESVELTPRIGSEVKADAATLLSGRHAAGIRALLERRGVLVFHDIGFDDDQLIAFADTLGEVHLDGRYNEGGIYKVTRDPAYMQSDFDYQLGTVAWHIDRTDCDVPPLGSMLSPRVLSRTGGETEFANTYAAYEDLPEAEKKFLEGLEVIHTTEANFRKLIADPKPEELASWRHNKPKSHPLVWRHRSGRKSMVLGGTADHIVGMDRKESDALIERLMEWSVKPEYTYRHSWRMGDLVMWDNTGTMHRVIPYAPESGRRLHRVTLVGEEPIRAAA
jgi:alpha-ketoglutarate-dependent taurine dioxygenase